MTYTMCRKGELDAGALFKLSEEQAEQGQGKMWTQYIAVDDVDDSAKKAQELGGTVIMPPFDVMEEGRMAVIQDPTGGIFSVWQTKKHSGAGVYGEPGAMSWNELMTTDVEKATAFYTGLFNWKAETMPFGSSTYTTFRIEGVSYPVAGMLPMDAEMAGIPPHWMIYFAVEDCDKACEQAKELGGNICVPAFDIPDVGRIAVVDDPQGGTFSVIAFS